MRGVEDTVAEEVVSAVEEGGESSSSSSRGHSTDRAGADMDRWVILLHIHTGV